MLTIDDKRCMVFPYFRKKRKSEIFTWIQGATAGSGAYLFAGKSKISLLPDFR